MRRELRIAVLLLGLLCIAAATRPQTQSSDWEQAAGGKMSFDVASVKRNKALTGGHTNIPFTGSLFTPTGGLFLVTDYPLGSYITFAYKLTGSEAAALRHELPSWAVDERFDIEARASGNPTKDQFRLMLQSLLASRFRLAIHYETKESQVLAIEIAKRGKLGPKIRKHPADEPCPTPGPNAPPRGTTDAEGFPRLCGYLSYEASHASGEFRIGASGVTMQQVASSFSSSEVFGTYPWPVIDGTGLTGTYDFVIEFSSDMPAGDAPYPQDPNGPSFVTAMNEQLGLKLETTKAPVESFVVDHIEEPSAN